VLNQTATEVIKIPADLPDATKLAVDRTHLAYEMVWVPVSGLDTELAYALIQMVYEEDFEKRYHNLPSSMASLVACLISFLGVLAFIVVTYRQ